MRLVRFLLYKIREIPPIVLTVDIPAYEIGAIFFLVVLVMAGTMTKGLLPRASAKSLKTIVVVLAILFGGFFAYHSLPPLSTIFDFSSPSAVEAPLPPPKAASPPLPAIKPARAPRAGVRIQEVPLLNEPAQPQAQPVEIVTPPEAPAEKQDKGVKRAVKSLGKFLHLSHDKPDTGQ